MKVALTVTVDLVRPVLTVVLPGLLLRVGVAEAVNEGVCVGCVDTFVITAVRVGVRVGVVGVDEEAPVAVRVRRTIAVRADVEVLEGVGVKRAAC